MCERLEPYLESQVVGQGLALRQLCDAVCDHVSNANPNKPLVLSVHGPPGVGKSMVHQLAARALYNREPSADTQCPGIDCPGYKVQAPTSPASRQHLRSPAVMPHWMVRYIHIEREREREIVPGICPDEKTRPCLCACPNTGWLWAVLRRPALFSTPDDSGRYCACQGAGHVCSRAGMTRCAGAVWDGLPQE